MISDRSPHSLRPAPASGHHPLWEQRVQEAFQRIAGRLTLALVFAAFCLFLFIRIAHEMLDADTKHFDATVLQYFQAHQTPVFHSLMTAISWLAGQNFQWIVVVAAIIGFTLKRRFFPDGLAMLVAGAGGVGLMIGLKAAFHRPRPQEIFAHLGYSFPSGHSFFAVVVYGMLAYWLARDKAPRLKYTIWAIAVLMILLVGFSRVFLGEHFPSDVAAGFAVGVPWLWGCLALPAEFRRFGQETAVRKTG